MQFMGLFLEGIIICRAIEAFQGTILFKRKNQGSKLKFFCNMPVISNNGWPFYKTSGFKCTPKFDCVDSYLRRLEDDSKIQSMCI